MYTLLRSGLIRREDGAFIPPSPGNAEYESFLKWQEDGGVAEAEADKPRVPQVISRAQGKAVLQLTGLWDDVLAFTETLTGEELILANIALFDTNEYRRDSPFLIKAAQALGLSDILLDELFIQGDALLS